MPRVSADWDSHFLTSEARETGKRLQKMLDAMGWYVIEMDCSDLYDSPPGTDIMYMLYNELHDEVESAWGAEDVILENGRLIEQTYAERRCS